MDKGDAGAPSTGAGDLVDESDALLTQMLEGDVDRRNGEGNMVQALAPALEEAADRRVGAERLQQLDEGSSHRDHRLLDTLSLHHLAIQRLNPISRPVVVECLLQIMHRNGDVVEIQQLHRQEGKGRCR